METKNITVVRIYKLILNPMYELLERKQIVAISTDYNRLVSWYRSQLADDHCYMDNGYNKVFKKGSPLELFNRAGSLNLNDGGSFGHGIFDEWIDLNDFYKTKNSGRFRVI